MTRAEMKRAAREEKKKKVTYNITQEQLDIMIARGVAEELKRHEEKNKEWLDKCAKQAVEEEFAKVEEQVKNGAIVDAMELTLILPLELLMDKYWPKTADKRCKEFANDLIERFTEVQDGKRDLAVSKQRVWEVCGVRFQEGEY